MRPVTATLFMFASLTATAAEAPPDELEIPFESHWVRVEVVLFERPGVTSDADGESLLDDLPRRYPAAARTLEDGEARERFYPLDAATRGEPRLTPLEPHPADDEQEAATESPAPPPSPEEALRLATAEFENSLRAQSFLWLPSGELRLADAARRLAATATYRVLHHGAWIQAVPGEQAGQPVLVQFGEAEAGVSELEGTLTVSLDRTLHFDAELWLRGDAPAAPEVAVANVAPIPGTVEQPPAEGTADGPTRYYVLHEDRRVNDGELHYLDHPRIGVLVRVDEVEPPAALRALAESLVGTTGDDDAE